MWEIQVTLSGQGTASARAALPIPISVRKMYPDMYGCQCLGFLTCAQMLMYSIAHGGGGGTP